MHADYLFRADSGAEIGLGHVKRCLGLAMAVPRGRFTAFVVRGGTGTIEEEIRQRSTKLVQLPAALALKDEISYLTNVIGLRAHVGVVDLTHKVTLADKPGFAQYVSGLGDICRRIFLIDGHGPQAMVDTPDFDVDVVLKPYAGAEPLHHDRCAYRQLSGSDYFILDRAMSVSDRDVAADGRRILVTFGGADPTNLTLKALQAIEKLEMAGLEVRIICGPVFNADLVEQIEACCAHSAHDMQVVYRPPSLAPHLRWCDVAVANTGLTKYELAATGTPSIQISLDPAHVEANTNFEKLGTAWHLGVGDDVEPVEIAEKLAMLLSDQAERRQMSVRGRHLVDGRGASRIIDEIEDLFDVATIV